MVLRLPSSIRKRMTKLVAPSYLRLFALYELRFARASMETGNILSEALLFSTSTLNGPICLLLIGICKSCRSIDWTTPQRSHSDFEVRVGGRPSRNFVCLTLASAPFVALRVRPMWVGIKIGAADSFLTVSLLSCLELGRNSSELSEPTESWPVIAAMPIPLKVATERIAQQASGRISRFCWFLILASTFLIKCVRSCVISHVATMMPNMRNTRKQIFRVETSGTA